MAKFKVPAHRKLCEHYECRCARAAELAAMDRTEEAIAIHGKQVMCRRADERRERAGEERK